MSWTAFHKQLCAVRVVLSWKVAIDTFREKRCGVQRRLGWRLFSQRLNSIDKLFIILFDLCENTSTFIFKAKEVFRSIVSFTFNFSSICLECGFANLNTHAHAHSPTLAAHGIKLKLCIHFDNGCPICEFELCSETIFMFICSDRLILYIQNVCVFNGKTINRFARSFSCIFDLFW